MPRHGTALPSTAFRDPSATALGKSLEPSLAERGAESGIYALKSGLDAFAARVAIIDRAEDALDVQYYIVNGDVTGRFLLARLLVAAERGVRVRLLVDDMGTRDLDELLAALDVHPVFEVRLFNPFARGPWPGLARVLDFVWRPLRLNRRMHNKLITADGAVAIVGGRNLGDEYFDADQEVNFADLDLLAFGPVLHDLGESFDRYWNSPFAVPISAWRSLAAGPAELERARAELRRHEEQHADSRYAERVRGTTFVQDAAEGRLDLVWASVRAVADLPEKVTARRGERAATLLSAQLGALFPTPETELLIVSSYLVPGAVGARHLAEHAARGVRVAVLTNSLAATDVPAVHSGYSRYRRKLVAKGVELYELRPSSTSVRAGYRSGLFGSRTAALHAKTFVADGRRVFVGSFNLDPRSIRLNTELGLVVESEELAHTLKGSFEALAAPNTSWRIALEKKDGAEQLVWEGVEDGRAVRKLQEPGMSFRTSLFFLFLGLLPIEGQL